MTDHEDELAKAEEPILRFKKRTIVWRDLVGNIGLFTGMIGLCLATFGLLSQGNLAFILTGIWMVGIAYFFWDSFEDGIRMQYAATFTLYPKRAVMEFKRRPTISIDLDSSIRLDIGYHPFWKGPIRERVSNYMFLKDNEVLLEIDNAWGWKQEDLLRMWNPLLELIDRNGLRLGRELGILREMGGMVPRVES